MFLEDAQYAESHIEFPEDMDRLSDRMIEFLTKEKFDLETSIVSVQICQEQSSFVMNSYPLVAYCVSKYLPYKNFRHAVDQTINAGADTDSNGAMVGAIMAAHLGLAELGELIKGLRNWKMLMTQARQFEEAIR